MSRRTKANREKDLVTIAELYCKNLSVREIAEILNKSNPYSITFRTVAYDIHEILSEWSEKKDALITNHVAIELHKSLNREKKLWDAWEKSELQKQSKQVKKKGEVKDSQSKPQSVEVVEDTEDGIGYYKFMELMQKEADFRCKLLGSYAPKEFKGDLTINPFFELMKEASKSD